MILNNLCNGGIAEVDDDLGDILIQSGMWEEYLPPAQRAVAAADPAPKKQTTRKSTAKAAPEADAEDGEDKK